LDSVIIRLLDLPETVRGFTVKDENDDYNVYINARLSADGRAEAFRHEIDHIRLGHFYDQKPVADKEKEAKGNGKEIKRAREVIQGH